MSKTPTRLYTVTNKASGATRLVDSTTAHTALGHVTRDEYKVDVADAKTVAGLVASGVNVETAGVYASPSALGHAAPVIGADSSKDGPADLLLDSGEDLYRSAVSAIRAEGRVSISFVQRHLQLGYNHAARLVERMEHEGIVSAPDLHGVRTLLPTSA